METNLYGLGVVFLSSDRGAAPTLMQVGLDNDTNTLDANICAKIPAYENDIRFFYHKNE